MVAPAKPLRLKVQKSAAVQHHAPAENLPLARVLVDTGVLHLDQPFDYLISEKLDKQAQPGHLVAISFHGREAQGYILERLDLGQAKIGTLKYVDRVLSSQPLLLADQYDLFLALAQRYACSIWAFIAAAIPARVATAEKNYRPLPRATYSAASLDPSKLAITLPLNQDRWKVLVDIVLERCRTGQVLVVVPEESDLENIAGQLQPHFHDSLIVQSSARSASERYRNYLHICAKEPTVILTTRSGLFAPLMKNSTIIVFEESSPSHYEKRYPGWNTRDVALLRTDASLIFLGDSWSTELARLIQLGYVKSLRIPGNHSRTFAFAASRDSHLASISRGLRNGSVLISIAHSSRLTGLSCRKCRNRALCECGGVLIFSAGKAISCSLCNRHYSPWVCSHCSHSELQPIKKDPAMLAENLARAFPGHRVIISTSAHRIARLSEAKTLVIATIGHEPMGEYSAVVILDAEFLINRPGLRTEESLLAHWLSLIALADPTGEIFLSLPASHPLAGALSQGNATNFLAATLADRSEVQLPPFFRFAIVELGNENLATFIVAAQESSIFSMITPIALDELHTRVILRAPVEQSVEFSAFFLSMLRYRSLKGLPGFTVRIDPYSF